MRRWIMALVVMAGAGLPVACDEADAAFDCHQVCSRYQSCFDADYDVSACRDRCRDKARDDQDWDNKADACEACIDDRSCSDATFSCATECVGIVP